MTQPSLPAHLKPLRVGQILDRAFDLLPMLCRRLGLWLLIIAIPYFFCIMVTTATYSMTSQKKLHYSIIEYLLAYLLLLIISNQFAITCVREAALLWLGKAPEPWTLKKIINPPLILSNFFLTFIISIVSALYSLLLIIPGLIYSLNRILSNEALILEDLSIGQALRRSKNLMTFHPELPWYSFSTPFMRAGALMTVLSLVGFVPNLLYGAAYQLGVQQFGESIYSLPVLLIGICGQVLVLITLAYNLLAQVAFYIDLRVRQEGLDLQLILADKVESQTL